jgi:hypothetical protein
MEVVSFTTRPLNLREKEPPVAIGEEVVFVGEPVLTL